MLIAFGVEEIIYPLVPVRDKQPTLPPSVFAARDLMDSVDSGGNEWACRCHGHRARHAN